jgi:hypothetical protein
VFTDLGNLLPLWNPRYRPETFLVIVLSTLATGWGIIVYDRRHTLGHRKATIFLSLLHGSQLGVGAFFFSLAKRRCQTLPPDLVAACATSSWLYLIVPLWFTVGFTLFVVASIRGRESHR